MSKEWDDKMKRLFAASPQDFIAWLLPGARFVRNVSLELKMLTRTRTADVLCQVEIREKDALFHLELQKHIDPEMVERVWEYNFMATRQYKCPVYSAVIYVMPGGKVPESYLEIGLDGLPKVHRFQFTNIMPWTMTVQDIRQWKLKGLLPLCFLTKDGARQEVVEEMLEELQGDDVLLTLALGIGSMVFTTPEQQVWFKGRTSMLEEILRDTPFFQDLMQEGRQEGLDQGLQKGRQEGLDQGLKQGELAGLRQTVLEVVQERFPQLLDVAQQRVSTQQDSVGLRHLIVKMSVVQTPEKAEQCLRDL